jgi:hypothetical protein
MKNNERETSSIAIANAKNLQDLGLEMEQMI